MAKPPFTMSKYANELELQRDARKYYQDKFNELKALADGMGKTLEVFEIQGSDKTEALREYSLWKLENSDA